ncbi:MAG: right-handed parallel beta-helix repeat-containing protein [Deltaproteobacteria bacterium]|nr:right-handed parallel beta-helix repeat-containing protein [Deltaproteobacteria bacterium]MBW2446066.1 right-handed parallel beta-helix repeat-containing protein [Deltaproteobacteria bacterium]
MRRPLTRVLALVAVSLLVSSCQLIRDPSGRTIIHLAPLAGEPAEDFQIRVRQAFNLAQPGTILEFGVGYFNFTAGLSVSASHVIVRGQGMNATSLDFSTSDAAEGILVSGDHFSIHDIAVIDPPGDGVKAVGIDGFTAKRLRVAWSSVADSSNGPYGIYPVLSQNILIEACHVRGAEDAGIYVGQSTNILVQYNYVDGNVAGIEIENSIDAQVRFNVATENAAGILVFDLTGLSQAGHSTRVHDNWVFDNNTVNFGHGFLALVPSGTGMLIVSTDDVEIFENEIHDNRSVGIGVISYELSFLPFPPDFDAWPEMINVHDNAMSNNGQNPDGLVASVVAFQFSPKKIPHIFWDSITPTDKTQPGPPFPSLPGRVDEDGFPLPGLKMCVRNNSRNGDPPAALLNQEMFGTMGLGPDGTHYDEAFHDCTYPSVPPVHIPDFPPVPDLDDELSPEETEALCGAMVAGVNWDAFEANCPVLSGYNLFQGNDPRGPVVEAGFEYGLTTPLFSDYTNKYRFVFVPPGEAAAFSANGLFDFPVGTIITKTFGFDLPAGGEQVVETRLLIRRATGWKALVYLWDSLMTVADFTPEGAILEITFQHPDDAPGVGRTIDYGVPDTNQCAGCHEGIADDMDVVGLKARVLNRPHPADPVSGTNQLTEWATAGILTGLPALGTVDRLPVWNDPSDGTLGERARAYLETNCAHCHRPNGRAGFTSLWLNIQTPEGFNLGFCKSPIAAGPGAGGLEFDIVPGDSSESILSFRLNSAVPAIEMPELAKAIVHDEGVALVNSWIDTLTPTGCEVE